MDNIAFYKGWALLTAQPYAQFLAYDDLKFTTQQEMFRKAFLGFDGETWMKAIDYWLLKQTEWPKIPELMSVLKAKSAVPYRLTHQPVGAPLDYLPRQIYQRAKAEGRTIRELALELLPPFSATCDKEDADSARAQTFLTKAEQGFPVRCDCRQWHPACQPCPICEPERQ